MPKFNKHFGMTRCLSCREDYIRDVTDLGPQICDECQEVLKVEGCCKCKRTEPAVQIIVNKEDDSVWRVACADKEAELNEKE
jgi:hypothetical protein